MRSQPTRIVRGLVQSALAAAAVLSLLAPDQARAAAIEFIVHPNKPGGCHPADNCYTTIQAAIDEAARRLALPGNSHSFTVLVEPGTYAGPITLRSNIPIRGRETARTILTGGGSGTVVTASGVTGVTFRNFTVTSATIGIDVSGGSSITIENNIFRLGMASGVVAVRVQGTASPATSVKNNTFHQNATALSVAISISITNNIFSEFTTALVAPSQNVSLITNNAFTANPNILTLVFQNNVGTGQNRIVSNPLFVDPPNGDFHLQATSECIDNGFGIDTIDNTTADIGAYGGSNADSIPFRIPKPTLTNVPVTSIEVRWQPNNSYLTGGYNIHYRLNRTGAPYETSIDRGTATTAELTGLNTTPPVPAAPLLQSVGYTDGTLRPQWTSVPGATGYTVYYRDTATSEERSLDVGNTLSHDITGLINGRSYDITVTAYTQNTYYISVTTYTSVPHADRNPGVRHESAYSEELSVAIGNLAESGRSNRITEYPEPITPYPNLPNTGCFIATAVYGNSSAPEVMALRRFRDQYLLTNAWGRALAAWYYRHGPAAAAFIADHPSLTPVLRTALRPIAGFARFMTHTTPMAKLTVLLSFAVTCLLALLSVRTVLARKRPWRRSR